MTHEEAVHEEGGVHFVEGELELTNGKKRTAVRYAHFKPEGAAEGEPVMFFPGYGMGLKWETGIGTELARNKNDTQREVFLIEHSREELGLTISKLKKLYPDAHPLAWQMHTVVLIRAHEAVQVLRASGARAHFVGHSLGGMTAVAAALLDRSAVSSITLLNSGGLIKPDALSAPKLFGRFIANWWHETRKKLRGTERSETMGRVVWDTLFNYIFFRGWSGFKKAVQEELAVAHTDMLPMLHALKEQGVAITIVYDQFDRVFPAQEVAERLREKEIQESFTVIQTDEHLHYGAITSPRAIGNVARESIALSEERA